MGRAAAVRAATKGKTDAKKAKVNAYYGKKIIMAVKQGGSSDPVANRQLGELIKAAKNNSVPMDVSSFSYFLLLEFRISILYSDMNCLFAFDHTQHHPHASLSRVIKRTSTGQSNVPPKRTPAISPKPPSKPTVMVVPPS